MPSRFRKVLPLRRFSTATTSLVGAASLLLLPAPRTSSAAPPASGKVRETKASSHTQKKQVPDLDNWYGVLIDSQHIGYLHIAVKQKTFTSPALWDCVVDMYANPSPGNPATVQQKVIRCIMREGSGILESWDTTTDDGKTKTTHHKYSEKEIRAGKNIDKAKDSGGPSSPLDLVGANSLTKLPKGWTIGKEEIITVDYQPVRATRVTATGQKDPSQNGSYWVDRDHQLVRADVQAEGSSFRLERMSPASAVHLVTPLPANLDVITPAKPLDTARELGKRNYILSGLAVLPHVDSDDVETIALLKQPDGHYTAIIQITAAPIDEKSSPAISAIDKTKFAAYLASGNLTPANDPAMVALAHQIVGTETNSARAAKRLNQWIYTNLSYDWGFSGYRSAQQTLKDRQGVCQNYATLLVTLARAAGIPAKYCSGPTYVDGKYYRHAWAECWTGKWVTLEPTWGKDYADSCHVKLEEGEPDTMLDAWNSSAPPTIDALAPNADIAQVIRDHTPVAPRFAPTPDTAKDAQLAKQIMDTAGLPPNQPVQIATVASYSPTVLMQLPWGTTTRIVQSALVRDAKTQALLSGIQYTLPDGRSYLVITPDRQKPDELEASLAMGFEYREKEGKWTHAFVPYLKFPEDKAEFVKEITSSTTAVNRIMYANPPASDTLLPLLPQGTTASPMEDPDGRDAKGHLLTGTTYRFPDGKTCVVMKMGDFE